MKVSIKFKQKDNPVPFIIDKAEICDIVRIVFNPKGEYFNVYKKGGLMTTIYIDKLEGMDIDCELLKGENKNGKRN